METPEQAARRLLSALAELVTQESLAVHTNEYGLIESIQLRAGVIGAKLIELAANPAVAKLRHQVDALLAERWQSGRVLQQRLLDVSAEISRLQGAHQRLTRVAPAYSSGPMALPRFTAAA